MSGQAALGQFEVALTMTIRACTETDLDALEWFGLFTAHREIIRKAFDRQRRGENVMLVAAVHDFPAAQVWIDLTRYADRGAGLLWAVRVFPILRGMGIGNRLIAAAERVLRERGFRSAEIGVEKHNVHALRLYKRLGYEIAREELEEYSYLTPYRVRKHVVVDEWMLCKELDGKAHGWHAHAPAIARRQEAGVGAG